MHNYDDSGISSLPRGPHQILLLGVGAAWELQTHFYIKLLLRIHFAGLPAQDNTQSHRPTHINRSVLG